MRAASAANEVRAAASRLREAGAALRTRPRAELVALLGALLEALRNPASALRKHLADELPAATGFHPTTLAAGLDAGFAPWTAKAFAELAESELSGNRRRIATGFPLSAVVLGGAIPMPSVLQLLAPLALGSPVLARPGAHDPVTARAVASELSRLDADLGRCLEVVSFAHADSEAISALAEAECVVATGGDDAVAAIAARVRPWQRFVGYGHRFSIAVLARADACGEAYASIARDTALWDQLGCLSPLALYAVGWRWEERAALLGELELSFAKQAALWPSGRIASRDAALRANEIATFELRAASSGDAELRRDSANRWALLAEREGAFRGSPLHRVLRVHCVPDTSSIVAAVAPVARHLACIGASSLDSPEATTALASLRPSRLCALGEMQAPPISWCHDGRGVLLPLAALIDLG